MTYTKLPSDATAARFFARLRSFDIACPRCDYTMHVRHNSPAKVWQPRTGRWRCPDCGLRLQLGIIGWKSPGRPGWQGVEDQTPTVKEALELRRGLSIYAETKERRFGEAANALLEKVEDMPPPEPKRERELSTLEALELERRRRG